MDNGGFVVAGYVVTATLVILYTWRLARRLREARKIVNSKRLGA